MDVLDQTKFKESVSNFGMHLPFLQQILTIKAINNSISSQNWKDMAKAILEPASHLQCFSWWREEVKEIAWKNRAMGRKPSKDQLLDKVCFAETLSRGAVCVWWGNFGTGSICSLKCLGQSCIIREELYHFFISWKVQRKPFLTFCKGWP